MEEQTSLSQTTERSDLKNLQTSKITNPKNKVLTRFFWITILTLAAVSISLTVAGISHTSQPKKQEKIEFSSI